MKGVGVGQIDPHPLQKKISSKNPALSGLNIAKCNILAALFYILFQHLPHINMM